jgi:hypothetical protein
VSTDPKRQRRFYFANFIFVISSPLLCGERHLVRLRGSDRALLIWMTQIWPSLLGDQVVQPVLPRVGKI